MIDHLRRSKLLIDPIHLRLTALVAPDQRRTDYVVVAIENHQPVHLSGKAEASDLIAGDSGSGQRAANRLKCRVGPVFRTLLGPQRLLHHHFFVSNRDCGGLSSAGVEENRP